MANDGYQNPSIKDEVMERLEKLRIRFGLTSIPKTIERLVDEKEKELRAEA